MYNRTTDACFDILPPRNLEDKVLFQVFDKARPIAYARLEKHTPGKKRTTGMIDMFDPDGSNCYTLKMIEVTQNYRNLGVGSTLLQTVVDYCRKSKIQRLTGEIKGDVRTLRHWYTRNGFKVSANDRIEMMP